MYLETNKKIIRLRPGHLANFSGGAGYMPFIILFSVPISFIFKLISSIIVYFVARKIMRGVDTSVDSQSVGLAEFVAYSKKHLIVMFILSIVASIALFIFGLTLVYGDKTEYIFPTILLAAGPLVSFLISTKVLFNLTINYGYKVAHVIGTTFLYILMTVILIALGLSMS